MGFELFAAVLGLAASIVSNVLADFLNQRLKQEGLEREETIEERVDKLAGSLRESVALIREIENEIEDRHEIVDKLREDVKRYEQLAKIGEEETEAVAQLIRGEFEKESRRSLWQEIGVNFAFFIAGLIVAVFFGL